jgi:glutamine---fructose-6-phosphate transaminase (isomerizing)
MSTNLEAQIRSQPDLLTQLIESAQVRQQVHEAVEGLHRASRIWLVGTGTSQHAAALGAAMIQEAGRSAHAVSSMQFVQHAPIVGPRDAVIVISHTGETAYALATRSLAFQGGMHVVMITKQGSGFPDAIETVPKESSETYTVSYTAALVALALLAAELGAESITEEKLALVPGSVRNAIEASGIGDVPTPGRVLVFVGAGLASWTAREAALKVREAARFLAEGYDAEYLLHGSAVPLTAEDGLVLLTPPDTDGFVRALGAAATAEGLPVSHLDEPSPLPEALAQIPLTVRAQLLALRIALENGQDPDKVIVGNWDDAALWGIGSPIG